MVYIFSQTVYNICMVYTKSNTAHLCYNIDSEFSLFMHCLQAIGISIKEKPIKNHVKLSDTSKYRQFLN